MPKITFIAHSGQRHTVEAEAGLSLMRAAIDHNVPGIDGDCGGACACATCHVFVEGAWAAKTGVRTQQENDMLNFAAELRDSSRLACQITVTDDLDGLEVTMPEGQH
ncbi:2Fe-2S iron-sulfur cluster-binding protein [Pseudaquabacterium pictum]|uniref:2Fe-2S ferredoxin n=1 Tax=Pseudaquabacterium pictum TaxID=2315236 RepID=A0A480ANN2_9BURK|nr:2Fe-2S iron-sulfur cluster-binding protein [Rubrivivax pictus]GCL61672.1 2Fe-2S ferredoxin [Rubrivivax pictus]